MMIRTSWLLAAAIALAGCGRSSDQAASPPDEGDRALLESVEQPLDRARSVQDITAEQKRQMDEQIEAEGR